MTEKLEDLARAESDCLLAAADLAVQFMSEANAHLSRFNALPGV